MDCSALSNYSCESSNKHKKTHDKKTKKKITKGAAAPVRLSTDPQSIAARHRRHRISDRFKILQSLVPGGTKMDTVSMLEQAIQYVKYLKTQIWLHEAMIMTNTTSSTTTTNHVVYDQLNFDMVDHLSHSNYYDQGNEVQVAALQRGLMQDYSSNWFQGDHHQESCNIGPNFGASMHN